MSIRQFAIRGRESDQFERGSEVLQSVFATCDGFHEPLTHMLLPIKLVGTRVFTPGGRYSGLTERRTQDAAPFTRHYIGEQVLSFCELVNWCVADISPLLPASEATDAFGWSSELLPCIWPNSSRRK